MGAVSVDRVLEHKSAPHWVWSETFGGGWGARFRVVRIPAGEDEPMREEIVHKSNLADCVEDLSVGAYTVMVERASR